MIPKSKLCTIMKTIYYIPMIVKHITHTKFERTLSNITPECQLLLPHIAIYSLLERNTTIKPKFLRQ